MEYKLPKKFNIGAGRLHALARRSCMVCDMYLPLTKKSLVSHCALTMRPLPAANTCSDWDSQTGPITPKFEPEVLKGK